MTTENHNSSKPKVKSSFAERELDKADKQFQEFDSQVKSLTLDRMNQASTQELEPQTKISQSDRDKLKDIYLKPIKTIGCADKFNEKFREQYNFAKEYVNFEAENNEIIGESIDLWTRPFPGIPAEEWKVPVNTPVWGPRYLAEQIKKCKYHRLVMQPKTTGYSSVGEEYGQMAAETTIQRLDARPVVKRRSIFMGATNF